MLTIKSNSQIYRSSLKRCLRLFTTGKREKKIKSFSPPTCAYPLRVVCVWGIFPRKTSVLLIIKIFCVQCTCVQSWLTLCNPMDCSLPDSFVHGIFQTRILEWIVISYSRGSSPLRDPTGVFCVSCTDRWITLQLAPPGKPWVHMYDQVSFSLGSGA